MTSKFYIIDNPYEESDGIIQSREKINIGKAWNKPAPTGSYINCSLDGYWIISDEEYKLFNKLKKNNDN